jgi:hypothetical protein
MKLPSILLPVPPDPITMPLLPKPLIASPRTATLSAPFSSASAKEDLSSDPSSSMSILALVPLARVLTEEPGWV